MAGWIVIPCKRSEAVDFKKPLEKFIKNTFSEDVLKENSDAISDLNKLRNSAVMQTPDKHESALEPLLRYYDQLVAIEGKLPINESQIRVSFTWFDCFDKGSLFGYKKASLATSAYERLCLLFNIGALESQIASAQNLQTDDGLKLAAKMFQSASGCFNLLKDSVYAQLHQVPTPDMSVEMLNALGSIMLAQGQESIWFKTEHDKMKDGIIAKVAAQLSDFYNEANQACQVQTVKQQLEKEWTAVLGAKQKYFKAISQYHQATVAMEKGKYGENVARLKLANQLVGEAAKESMGMFDTKTWVDRIKRGFVEAEKDNNLIYHDMIPSVDTLAVIGRASLAKSLPLSKPASINFIDMFTKLVPMAVHGALTAYENRKAEIINFEVGRLREGTQLINSILASLNLPAAIEDLSGDKVPKSVLEKAATVKERGGVNTIDSLMQDLPELLQRNREILDEAARMMDEEEGQDTQMRERFTSKWTPKPSAELTAQLRDEANKYRGILENAVRADAIVREKYNAHRQAMDLLCKGESEIAAALPTVNASSSATAASSTVQQLRKLLSEIDSIKAAREGIEEDLKAQQDDMAVKFLSALAADGSITDCEGLISGNLASTYEPIQDQVKDSISRQEKTLAAIQTANEKFVQERQEGRAVSEREAKLKELASAFDIYMELTANLKEGTKFYNDLTPILVRFQQKISDLVFARKTEREELSRSLQNTIAQQPAEPTPAAPPHHAAQGARQPPPSRPPPPRSQAPSAPSSAPAQYPGGAPPAYATAGQYYQPMPMPGYAPYQYSNYTQPGGMGGYGGYPQQPPLPGGYYYGAPPGGYPYPQQPGQPRPGGPGPYGQ
ncbi:programmed cell death 6-interacting protein [Nematostella vectensis]|uniref:programmed cell death 6-interacting protein n=1 Tax=Nematostella vectensis TaxID=45351 RepID=UPI0020774ED4|nr:programmed cell death 6-interacting protein [Nematostella vectensis]